MPAYYRAQLQQFLQESPSSVIGELAIQNGKARFPLVPEAIEAWRTQLPPLQSAAQHLLALLPGSASWEILLEYPIPRVGKRIDAVLLANNVIVVIELKTGDSPTSAALQVDDYSLNLACFHECSRNQVIVPVVVSNSVTARRVPYTQFDSLIKLCRFSSMSELGSVLVSIYQEFGQNTTQIDAATWDEARFRPIPP